MYNMVFNHYHTPSHHTSLTGEITLRSWANTLNLQSLIELHCEDNTFKRKPPLKSSVSSALVSDGAKNDILPFAECRATSALRSLFQNVWGVLWGVCFSLISTSRLSVWDKKKKEKRRSSKCVRNVAGKISNHPRQPTKFCSWTGRDVNGSPALCVLSMKSCTSPQTKTLWCIQLKMHKAESLEVVPQIWFRKIFQVSYSLTWWRKILLTKF